MLKLFNFPKFKLSNCFLMVGFLFFVSFANSFPIQAQVDVNLNNPQVTPSQIDDQAENIENKRNSKEEIEKNRNTLQKEIDQLEAEISKLQTEIKTLENDLTQEKNLSTENFTEITNQIEEAEQNITTRQQRIQENQNLIQDLENKIEEREKEINQEINTFQSVLLGFGIRIAGYILLIGIYWVIYRVFNFVIKKYIENEKIHQILRNFSLFLTIIASLITILLAFLGNLNLLLGGFGLFSAALVVALQDYVASFFAWILISSKNEYKIGDIIRLPIPGSDTIFGKVVSIGWFRTTVKERMGGETINKELSTGRVVSFPNNMFLKTAIANFTQGNAILWHNLSVIITFESDYQMARKILDKTIKDQFKYALDHKDVYLDDVFNLEQLYQPKMYMSIAENGPEFTIWFAARAGKFREVLEYISNRILEEFNQTEGKIELAYRTSRIISTPKPDGVTDKVLS